MVSPRLPEGAVHQVALSGSNSPVRAVSVSVQRNQNIGVHDGSPDESGVGWAGDGCERLSQGPGGGQGAEDGGLVDGIVALGERSEPPCGGGQQSGQAGQLLQAGDLGQALQVGGAAGAGV